MCDRLNVQENCHAVVSGLLVLQDLVLTCHRRLQSVTNELRQLKEALNAQTAEDPLKTTSTPSISGSASSLQRGDRSRGPQQRSLPSSDPFGLCEDEKCLLQLKEARLEDSAFDQNDIRNLFLL